MVKVGVGKVASRRKGPKDLTWQQLNFVVEYLVDMNGTAAAKRAGYAEESAPRAAGRLMRLPLVIAEIKKRMEKRIERTEIDADWVLRELAELAQSDIRDVFDPDTGYLKQPHQMDRLVAKFVSSIDWSKDGVAKVKFTDRLRLLELIGKHVGVSAFAENVNFRDEDALVKRITEARRTLREQRKLH